jgi:hypothetical protein
MFQDEDVCAAFIAGFFDGEGSVNSHYNLKTGYYQVKLSFAQRNARVLEVIQSETARFWNLNSSMHQQASGLHGLTFQGSQGHVLAKNLVEYSIVKRSQLDWFIYTWDNCYVEGTNLQNKVFLDAQFRIKPKTDYN